MGLFQFLFGRKKDIDDWDEELEPLEATGEQNAEPVADPPEMPVPATEASEFSEEMNAVFESITNSVSARMMEEQSKKTAPVRVTPVPVSRRSAPRADDIPEQSEPVAECPTISAVVSNAAPAPESEAVVLLSEQPEFPDAPVPADPEYIQSETDCTESAEIPEPVSEETVIPDPDDALDIPAEDALDHVSELTIPAVAEEPDFPSQPDIQAEPVQSAAPTEAPVEKNETTESGQDNQAKPVPFLERDGQMKKSGKKSSHEKRSNAEQRIVLRLRGTTKPHCIKALENCFTGQHVFISYDSKRARCFVYTEEGEEIGRLSRSDSKKFAEEYDARIHSTYITKIKKEDDRFRVKLLLLIAAQQPFITERTRF